jgi:mRNA interferase RelE/StbE
MLGRSAAAACAAGSLTLIRLEPQRFRARHSSRWPSWWPPDASAVPEQQGDDLLLSPRARRAHRRSAGARRPSPPGARQRTAARSALPGRLGAPLREPFAGLWRARRGEYRMKYEIDETQRLVRVLDIDYRRDAYRA